MTDVDLAQLVDYHYWARDRMLTGVAGLTAEQFTRDVGGSFTSVRDTLVHVYGAEWVWYQRWNGVSPTALPEPAALPDVASLRDAWATVESGVRRVVSDSGPTVVDKVCAYTNLAGIAYQSTYGEVLQHLVNHGTYHRGQVATLLRQLGAAPALSTDLIQFFRERRR